MPTKLCGFWDCEEEIDDKYEVCRDHYADFRDGYLDECPECGWLKDEQYELYLSCHRGDTEQVDKPSGLFGRVVQAVREGLEETNQREKRPARPPQREKTPEPVVPGRSITEPRRDDDTEVFYAYICECNDGGFYAGQTNDLRARIYEHRRGKTKSLVGREPKLVWFSRTRTRDDARTYEKYLWELINSNERAITRLVIEFNDLIGEIH